MKQTYDEELIAVDIHDPSGASDLFEELQEKFSVDIPYHRNGSQMEALALRQQDLLEKMDMLELLKKNGFGEYIDHIGCYRTSDERIVLTLSPLGMNKKLEYEVGLMGEGRDAKKLQDYEIYVSRNSIYGSNTDTLCMWRSR
ncbi:MAG: hypothetical protein VZT48_07550 [Bulleidia sp.]|nr:hypothetical protein [Bulleidia sp.]